MATGLYNWSQTPGSNATATYTWAEGQAPSSINDSARGIMADVAKYRDDIAGAIVTGGTSTAYTVTSYSVYDTLAHMNGAMIAFTPNVTCGATVTLNVDSLGAKPLRTSTGVELLAGTLIAGTPYVATYNNSDAVWYLQGFFANPYNIPLGGCLPYFGATAPNTAFAIPIGQQISQTTYATLYTLFGSNKYGADAGGNFFLPDLTGRVLAGKEASATRLTSSYFGGNSTVLGATGGLEDFALATTNLPPYTPTGTVAITAHIGAQTVSWPGTGGGSTLLSPGGSTTVVIDGETFTGVAQGGVSTPIRTVQPTIICNYILRVI
jgi:microcystin-dependent protein